MNKRIIDKIRFYQSIVKNKNKTCSQRQMAYLELKRLNKLKEAGNIVKMPDKYMPDIRYNKNQIHHYLIYNTSKKNISNVNLISHTRSSKMIEVKSLRNSDKKSFIKLKSINFSRNNKPLKFYNFYESNLNYKIDPNELKSILEKIKNQ